MANNIPKDNRIPTDQVELKEFNDQMTGFINDSRQDYKNSDLNDEMLIYNIIERKGLDQNVNAPITYPYLQESRNHFVTIKITKENDNMYIELIDSKGGASKRPEAEYSKNPIKRFGQKVVDKVGGSVDKVVSTVVGNKELDKLKKQFQESIKKDHPNTKIITILTKLETQRDNISSGRHVIENITAIATGNKVETNFEKANINIMKIDQDIIKELDSQNKKNSTEVYGDIVQNTPQKSPKKEPLPIMSKSTTTVVKEPALVSPGQTPSQQNGTAKGHGR